MLNIFNEEFVVNFIWNYDFKLKFYIFCKRYIYYLVFNFIKENLEVQLVKIILEMF